MVASDPTPETVDANNNEHYLWPLRGRTAKLLKTGGAIVASLALATACAKGESGGAAADAAEGNSNVAAVDVQDGDVENQAPVEFEPMMGIDSVANFPEVNLKSLSPEELALLLDYSEFYFDEEGYQKHKGGALVAAGNYLYSRAAKPTANFDTSKFATPRSGLIPVLDKIAEQVGTDGKEIGNIYATVCTIKPGGDPLCNVIDPAEARRSTSSVYATVEDNQAYGSLVIRYKDDKDEWQTRVIKLGEEKPGDGFDDHTGPIGIIVDDDGHLLFD